MQDGSEWVPGGPGRRRTGGHAERNNGRALGRAPGAAGSSPWTGRWWFPVALRRGWAFAEKVSEREARPLRDALSEGQRGPQASDPTTCSLTSWPSGGVGWPCTPSRCLSRGTPSHAPRLTALWAPAPAFPHPCESPHGPRGGLRAGRCRRVWREGAEPGGPARPPHQWVEATRRPLVCAQGWPGHPI